MAKSTATTSAPTPTPAPAPPTATPAPADVKRHGVVLSFPCVGPKPTEGFVNLKLDTRLTGEQDRACRAMLTHLRASGAVLKSGAPVFRACHVVQWLLENATFSKG